MTWHRNSPRWPTYWTRWGGRVTRIGVNPRYWPIIPRRIYVNGRVVQVGWFTSELDPHQILLLSGTVVRWNLLVIPPETAAPSAARLMTAAGACGDPRSTASALMAAEQPDGTAPSYGTGSGAAGDGRATADRGQAAAAAS